MVGKGPKRTKIVALVWKVIGLRKFKVGYKLEGHFKFHSRVKTVVELHRRRRYEKPEREQCRGWEVSNGS